MWEIPVSVSGMHVLSLTWVTPFHAALELRWQEAESVAAVTSLALFTKFERLSLERIVGSERAQHMLRSSKNTFLFC